MNSIRFFIAFSLMIGAISAQGMEVAPQNIQIKNDTDSNIYVTFISFENLSRIKPDEKPNQLENEVVINTTNQGRYTRGLRPRGTFNIKNFTDQDSLYVAFEPNIPINQSKRLDEPSFHQLFREEGTKIIDVKERQEYQTYHGIPYGTIKVFAPIYKVAKESLEDLIQLEKGAKVKTEEPTYKETVGQYQTIVKKLGRWINVFENLLNNDALSSITFQDIYRVLGLQPENNPTPEQLLDVKPGPNKEAEMRERRKNLNFVFHPDKHIQNKIKYNKATVIAQFINNIPKE